MTKNFQTQGVLEPPLAIRQQMEYLLFEAFKFSPLHDQWPDEQFILQSLAPTLYPEGLEGQVDLETASLTYVSEDRKVVGIHARLGKIPLITTLENELNPLLERVACKNDMEDTGEKTQAFLGWTILSPRIAVSKLPTRVATDELLQSRQCIVIPFINPKYTHSKKRQLY